MLAVGAGRGKPAGEVVKPAQKADIKKAGLLRQASVGDPALRSNRRHFAGPRILFSSSTTVAMKASGVGAASRAARLASSLMRRQSAPTRMR